MHHETAGWTSPLLGREMPLEVIGHAGARVLVFPTSMGSCREWIDRRMHEVLRDHLDAGWIQLYCLDQPRHENWGNDAVSAGHRAYVHGLYYRYVYEEVLPFTASRNGNPFLIVLGASLGATHAVTFGLKYPESVGRIVGMSGLYDLKRLTGGYSDENVYAVNPMDFMRHEHEPGRMAAFRRQDIILAIGRDDPMYANNCEFSGILWSKGIGNALRVWDGFAHDWPYWEQMVRIYLQGHD
ncbi:MAG TPA: alpha/beta hydrolase-fold protein [Gemmatimonadales bacterium]|nr:alpha/beta hydrolase-fold protein [Gemmatimonadales bacterium]